uniref:Putative lipocalin-2 1 n=1 Tax=Amblyomma triste TaxID=251400 RepID=A0A023GA37_AMBTT
MNFFMVPLFSALAVAVLGANPTKQDLYKALDTTQRIWTPLRSYERFTSGERHKCIYALKTSLHGDDYRFDQHFKHGANQWVTHSLYGTLSESGGSAILTVKNTTEGTGIPYTLRYWDSKNHCGILTFMNQEGQQECELHIWNDDLVTSPSSYACEPMYDAFCPGARKYMTYSVDCSTTA